MKKIIVLGGGTAGWMATALIAKKLGHLFSVDIIDASAISAIGVGEGSTPLLKTFFEQLNITEKEWMPACNATYKLGITFEGWSHKKNFSSYFNPFYSHFDKDYSKALIHNTHLRRSGINVHVHPNTFCFSAYLAEAKCSPIPPYHFPFDVLYGYHFDAALLATFIKKKVINQSVNLIDAEITSVNQDTRGNVVSLTDTEGNHYQADYFIDCTGFKSLLVGETLSTSFKSYANVLLNDSAVTCLTEKQSPMPSETRSKAMNCGWLWNIPLQNRTGNGYVYSSQFMTKTEAEEELINTLGLSREKVSFKHLSMKVGRLEQHWVNNCIAVGLSQGFIEPLEATALALTQQTIERFIDYVLKDKASCQSTFNEEVNASFDNVRDFVLTHYITSDRTDTKYWQTAREAKFNASSNLKYVFSTWMSNGDLPKALKDMDIDKYYSANSWHYMLSGMGIFPDEGQLKKASPEMLSNIDVTQFKDFFSRCRLNFESHDQRLNSLRE